MASSVMGDIGGSSRLARMARTWWNILSGRWEGRMCAVKMKEVAGLCSLGGDDVCRSEEGRAVKFYTLNW